MIKLWHIPYTSFKNVVLGTSIVCRTIRNVIKSRTIVLNIFVVE